MHAWIYEYLMLRSTFILYGNIYNIQFIFWKGTRHITYKRGRFLQKQTQVKECSFGTFIIYFGRHLHILEKRPFSPHYRKVTRSSNFVVGDRLKFPFLSFEDMQKELFFQKAVFFHKCVLFAMVIQKFEEVLEFTLMRQMCQVYIEVVAI